MSITNLTDQFAQDLRQTISIAEKLLSFYGKINEVVNGPFTNSSLQASLVSQVGKTNNLQAEIDQGVADLQSLVSSIVSPTL